MTGPEFSRIVPVGRLTARPTLHRIEADEPERRALALRFGLRSLDRLRAEIRLSRAAGGVRLDGVLEAAVVQSCVVTLDPVPSAPADAFTLIYRRGIESAEADRLTLETDEPVVFEPLDGDAIDIGEVVAQQLSLVMDPYPRAAGAALESEPDIETAAGEHRMFDASGSFARKA